VRYRKVEKMALITFVLVAVFGGLTIFFHKKSEEDYER
jgi:intracellular septation protein